jgi:excisionase family DNA binding protein
LPKFRAAFEIAEPCPNLRNMDADESKSMDTDALLTPEDVARKLVVSEETLTAWRCTRRQHIPFVKVGRLVRYRARDVDAYLDERLQAA